MTRNYQQINTQIFLKHIIEEFGTCEAIIENFDSSSAFTILNQCKCCERHRQNRPKKFEIWDKNNQQHSIIPKSIEQQIANLNDCSCDCRHLSRWLCRGKTPDMLCKKNFNK